MAITFLESPRFPDNIAFGATVGPTYLTVLTPVYSGREGRIPAWTQSRARFDVGRRSMNAADTVAVDAFFRAVKGRAYGFRIKDWTDFTVTTANGVLLQQTPSVFQLAKLYQSGGLSESRVIAKPVAGTVGINLNGTPQGVVALDTTTGLYTMTAQGSANVSTIVTGASTVVTLASAIAGLVVGGLLSLNFVTGAGAAALNNQAFVITAITGAQYTLNVTTSGTLSGGQGFKYLQPTDVFTWSGQFDVPARFDTDEMQKQIMDRNGANGDLLINWDSIPIVEIRV